MISCRTFVIALLAACGCSRSPQSKEAQFLKHGLDLQNRHDYSRAILEFKNAARCVPKDAEPPYRLGVAYLLSGQGAQALTALRQAVEINPKYMPAQLKLADLMLYSNDRDLAEQAVHQLQAMLTDTPFNAAISDRLGMAEWSLGRLSDAETQFQESVEKSPGDLVSAISLARIKLRGKDFRGASALLEAAARHSPRSTMAAVALAETYIVAGNTKDAEAELRRALALDSSNGMALMTLASLLAGGPTEASRLAEAEALLRRLSDVGDPLYSLVYGQFLWESARRGEAVAEFEKQARKAPADRQVRSRLIAAYVEMGRMPDAAKMLDDALRRNPKDADALLQRGSIALEAGRIEQAQADLQQAIHFIPNSAEAHFALATVHKRHGQTYEERAELNEALRLKPNLLPARLWLVQSLMVAGQPQAALDSLQQAPQAEQQVLAVAIERNWALLFLGRSKEVRANLDRTLGRQRYPDLLLQEAMLKMKDGDYAGARADAEEVLQRNPEEARAARIIVDSFVAQKQIAKAGERLAAIVAGHPGSAALERLEAKWFAALHRNEEARQALGRALAAEPKSVTDLVSLAELDLEEHRMAEAARELDQALQYEPKNVKGLVLRAEVEDRLGRPAAAAIRYRDALAIDETNLVALNNLANDVAITNPDEALSLAQRAMEAAPDNPGVEDTIGWMYYRKGMYQNAVQYLQAANSKEPNPSRRFHLGLAYMKVGDRDRGQKLVTLAIHEDPTLAATEQIR